MQQSFYVVVSITSSNQSRTWENVSNEDNPFLYFLSDEGNKICEGTIKQVECLNALKNMNKKQKITWNGWFNS